MTDLGWAGWLGRGRGGSKRTSEASQQESRTLRATGAHWIGGGLGLLWDLTIDGPDGSWVAAS